MNTPKWTRLPNGHEKAFANIIMETIIEALPLDLAEEVAAKDMKNEITTLVLQKIMNYTDELEA